MGFIVINNEYLERRMRECKSVVDEDINDLRHSMQRLEHRVDGLATDVHKITVLAEDINNSLRVVAESMTKLSDLPIVWDRVKSFWVVTSWIQKNFLPLSVLIALLIFAATDGGIIDVVKGLIP